MRSKQLVEIAKDAAEDKKGIDPVILKIGNGSALASYFLVVHGTSDRHVKTIAENVVDELHEHGEHVWHVEGMRDGRWVLLDYGDVVVHVFHYETRKFYNLERLWGQPERTRKRKKHDGRKSRTS
ncbi:MAG: ribosome silencing factor [Candidatus Omnitrophica bacterium]|nr:ribosome silencing factor [Candidatus Omnitrophota bacterium]